MQAVFKAIALQTRHILDEMHAKGHRIEAIYMSGQYPRCPRLFVRYSCFLFDEYRFTSEKPTAYESLGLGMQRQGHHSTCAFRCSRGGKRHARSICTRRDQRTAGTAHRNPEAARRVG
jgi:hypothetical protein